MLPKGQESVTACLVVYNLQIKKSKNNTVEWSSFKINLYFNKNYKTRMPIVIRNFILVLLNVKQLLWNSLSDGKGKLR